MFQIINRSGLRRLGEGRKEEARMHGYDWYCSGIGFGKFGINTESVEFCLFLNLLIDLYVFLFSLQMQQYCSLPSTHLLLPVKMPKKTAKSILSHDSGTDLCNLHHCLPDTKRCNFSCIVVS